MSFDVTKGAWEKKGEELGRGNGLNGMKALGERTCSDVEVDEGEVLCACAVAWGVAREPVGQISTCVGFTEAGQLR
jgi:hypothetical protein